MAVTGRYNLEYKFRLQHITGRIASQYCEESAFRENGFSTGKPGWRAMHARSRCKAVIQRFINRSERCRAHKTHNIEAERMSMREGI